MKLYRIKWLRSIALPLLKRFGPGDIRVRHHHTGDRLHLHAFRHKGYWYHGRRRESETMEAFRKLVPRGGTVIEVGGHIGYIAVYLAKLVGDAGQVHVFEPGPNNLPYIRKNVAPHPNLTLVAKGVGDAPARLTLYMESLTGQNNSFVQDFDMLEVNRRSAQNVKGDTQAVEVDVVTLDGYTAEAELTPDLIKIDVEGFELQVLQGARAVLERHAPILMVEIQSHHAEVLSLLAEHGYLMYDPDTWTPLAQAADYAHALTLNTFCFHPEHHADAMARLGLQWNKAS